MGKTPCVAAFSTVRALYGSYSGSLYQVRRADNTTQDIGVLSKGGVADAAAQDAFCAGTTCTISILYDQSGMGNHLTKAPGGSATYGPNPDIEAVADALPITIGGHKAYGVHLTPAASWTSPGQTGYRNTKTKGTAPGDQPETEYMVTDGTYFNGSCCFDFGNAEMQPVAGGPGTMEAIYFGNCNWWDKGNGNGPWVMADLEVGVFNQGGQSGATNNTDLSLAHPFVTAMLKGNSAQGQGGGPFTLKGANAQSGTLTTMYDGARPNGYSPMHKQGGIVLGIGGDNSSTARGNFYEGVMTMGYASGATDDAVQANIVAAGYGK
jgi:non-reducing end alpha-L-arabinofuranosidase